MSRRSIHSSPTSHPEEVPNIEEEEVTIRPPRGTTHLVREIRTPVEEKEFFIRPPRGITPLLRGARASPEEHTVRRPRGATPLVREQERIPVEEVIIRTRRSSAIPEELLSEEGGDIRSRSPSRRIIRSSQQTRTNVNEGSPLERRNVSNLSPSRRDIPSILEETKFPISRRPADYTPTRFIERLGNTSPNRPITIAKIEIFYRPKTFPDFEDITYRNTHTINKKELEQESETKEEEKFNEAFINGLPIPIFEKIADMLGSRDVARLFTASKEFQSRLSNQRLDLSDTPLTITQFLKYFPSTGKYNIVGLYIVSKADKDNDFVLNSSKLNDYIPNLEKLIIDGNYPRGSKINLADFIPLTPTKLKSITIMGTLSVQDLHGLENETELEELKIEYYRGENLQGIETLSKLKILDLRNCRNLNSIDNISILSNLVDVRFSKSRITELPNLKDCISLKRLILDGSFLENVDGIANNSLDFFKLFECNELLSISNLDGLTSLKKVEIEKCRKLNILDLNNCKTLVILKVEDLKVNIFGLTGCNSLEELQLVNLQEMEDLNTLKYITTLRNVRIDTCNQLNWLDGMNNCHDLEQLFISNCTSLVSVSALNDFPKLRNLSILGCPKVERLEFLNSCPNLEIVELKVSPLFNNLYFCVNCPKLVRLKVEESSVNNIQWLENHFNLTYLHLSSCNISTLLPLKTCPNLVHLDIHKCAKINSFNGLENCTKLKVVWSFACTELTNINALANNPSLIQLNLADCLELESVKVLTTCRSLMMLDLRDTHVKDLISLKNHPSIMSLYTNNEKCTGDTFSFNFLSEREGE
jgi:hypothetical protein